MSLALFGLPLCLIIGTGFGWFLSSRRLRRMVRPSLLCDRCFARWWKERGR